MSRRVHDIPGGRNTLGGQAEIRTKDLQLIKPRCVREEPVFKDCGNQLGSFGFVFLFHCIMHIF